MNRDKNYRLHQRMRIRRKRLAHVWIRFAVDKGDRRMMGIYAKTPVICSCPWCGNPRRHFRTETRQEITAWLALAESAFEFWNNEEDDVYDNL